MIKAPIQRALLILAAVVTLSLPLPAFSGQKTVVLLTSVHVNLWNGLIHRKFEHIFNHRFGDSGYQVRINQEADQSTLWKELHNPDNVAVFWLSHAGVGISNSAGIAAPNIIVDRDGYDLAPVFREIHPNIRYVGVIGCNSEAVIEKIREGLPQNPSLQIDAFDHKVNAKKALRASIETAKTWLRKHAADAVDPALCVARTGFKLDITRDQAVSRPIRIENQGITLGMLGRDETAVTVHASSADTKGLKLVMDAGDAALSANPGTLGRYTIAASGISGGNWVLFANESGPIGVTRYIYRFEGLVTASTPEAYQPFDRCF